MDFRVSRHLRARRCIPPSLNRDDLILDRPPLRDQLAEKTGHCSSGPASPSRSSTRLILRYAPSLRRVNRGQSIPTLTVTRCELPTPHDLRTESAARVLEGPGLRFTRSSLRAIGARSLPERGQESPTVPQISPTPSASPSLIFHARLLCPQFRFCESIRPRSLSSSPEKTGWPPAMTTPSAMRNAAFRAEAQCESELFVEPGFHHRL